jgi:hypothetical protein
MGLCGASAAHLPQKPEGIPMTDARKEPDSTPPTPDAGGAGDDWLTLPQAAKAIGKHRQTVLVLGTGDGAELTLDRRAGMTFVSRASVDAYLARRAEAGPVAASA